jgi:triacylglycerol lipase
MKKPVPPQKFREIRPPNENYTYFEDKDAHPFVPGATGFNLVNSSWLADFAMLCYGDEAFIRDTLDHAGLTGAGFDVKFFSEQSTQCLVTHNDKFVVLCFRGTEIDNFIGAFEDWRRNWELIAEPDESGGLVHHGFRKDLKEVWTKVKDYLGPLLTDGAGRTLWITGHSLGAALATLAAERAARDGHFKVQGVYPYGSSRVGDDQFREKYAALGLDAVTFRFVNNQDVVPKIPPGTPYVHVGQVKFIDAAGQLHDALPEETEGGIEHLLERLGHKGRRLLEDWIELTIPAPFADHAPIYYATYIWNNL